MVCVFKLCDKMENGKLNTRVKVDALLSVVSSTPIEPGKVHKLSLLDRAMGLHTIHMVFYYRVNPFINGQMPSDLDNLRISLSSLLDQYPTVVGRLTPDPNGGGWDVKCNDAGVRMVQASVDETVDEWLRSADGVEERELTMWEDMPQDPSFWSPFRIQISKFKCGGLAIGLSCTHMHADITSATMLIKSWAEYHRELPLTHPPTINLPPPPPSKNPTPSFLPSNHPTTPSKMATLTIKFPSSSIKKCLSQVENQCPEATPFDVLTALFWSRVTRSNESSTHTLNICMDARELGNPPIPFGYFGNAIHFSQLAVNADKLKEGLGEVSDYVHRHVEGLKGGDFRAVIGELESRVIDGEWPYRVYGPRLTCINMEHMVDAEKGQGMMYDVVFNEERPAHVSYSVGNVDGEGLIIVMPSAEGGLGRTVTVRLPVEEIDELCKDQGILDLGPTMLVSGNR